MAEQQPEQTTPSKQAPWPGSKWMPRWNLGELEEAPEFKPKNWLAMLGPGLLMGGAAIGGGEWLMGPTVTARYGGSLMWLATLSILGQVVYNIEVSRYALYSGEPIFSGKFRTLPGPLFWVFIYLVLDFGAIFPYLAASAATPVAAIWLGDIPDSTNVQHQALLKNIGYGIFLLAFVPLIFGGKIYNSLKLLMTFKLFAVLGFLLVLGVFYASPGTWTEIFAGFFKIGNVPVQRAEDYNGNGILDPGEDWDHDGHLDIIEPSFTASLDTNSDGSSDAYDLNADGQADVFIDVGTGKNDSRMIWPDLDGDGQPDPTVRIAQSASDIPETVLEFQPEPDDSSATRPVRFVGVDSKGNRNIDEMFIDYDRDGTRDGDAIDNVFVSLWQGRGWPKVDFSMIAFLAAFAAIAGSGGLSNAPVSNYTRDQGWGMGRHVGAIPSLVGGHNIALSHVGTVFLPDDVSMPRWKRWYRHVVRDQMVVWMPACFLGLALPSMLSVEFLKRGTVADSWTAAGMTAGGVQERVADVSGTQMGNIFWFMTLFCGFLVLAPSMSVSLEGFVRRWVDIFWTTFPPLRKIDPRNIKYVYFSVLAGYGVFGLTMLSISKPLELVKISTNIMNFALGFSCWHTMVLGRVLLPKQVRPGWFVCSCLFFAGLFFWTLAIISAMKQLGYL